MKKDITRAIIDATIDRGLREIYEDPRRSIRKMADLGRQFNKARFTKNLYDIFQDLLRNDDSPYYNAIEHLLQYTSRKNLKDFGINMGYNSFTKGGKLIRKLALNKKIFSPWNFIIRMDPTNKTGITPSDLIPIIADGKKLGVYSYTVRLENDLSYLEDLLKVFIMYDDCSFMLILPDQEINEEYSSLISACSNAIYFLPAFEDSFGPNSRLLKKKQVWMGVYTFYDNSDTELIISEESVWDYIPQECSFLLLIANDGVPLSSIEKTCQHIKQMRLAPTVPLFIFDLYGDTMSIQSLISGGNYFYELLPDASIHTESGDFKLNEGLPDLEKAFDKSSK